MLNAMLFTHYAFLTAQRPSALTRERFTLEISNVMLGEMNKF